MDFHRMPIAHENDEHISTGGTIPAQPSWLTLLSAEESNSNSTKFTEETEDYHRSLVSKILFVIGSFFYLMVDLIDLYQFNIKRTENSSDDEDYSDEGNDHNGDDDDCLPSIPIYELTYNMSMSTFFYILATFCYLLTACHEYAWAKHEDEEEVGDGEYDSIAQENSLISGRKPEGHDLGIDFVDTPRSGEGIMTGEKSAGLWSRFYIEEKPAPCTIRFNSKPQVEGTLEEKVAIIFGLSAAVDFVGAIFNDLKPLLSRNLYFLACHGYAIEAVVVIVGKYRLRGSAQTRSVDVGMIDSCTGTGTDGQSSQNKNSDSVSTVRFLQRMMIVGDVLFFTGSLIDVVLSYFYEVSDTLIFVESNCFSSFLWLIDSVIYLIAGSLIENEERFYCTVKSIIMFLYFFTRSVCDINKRTEAANMISGDK
jgi:hypothetical protein